MGTLIIIIIIIIIIIYPCCILQAIKSVKAYPLPITSGEEARILDGVGDKIVKLLTKKFADCKSAGSRGIVATRYSVCVY